MNEELRLLVDAYLNATLNDDELQQLEQVLRRNSQARRQFVSATVMHGQLAMLADEMRSAGAIDFATHSLDGRSAVVSNISPDSQRPRWMLMLAVATSIFVAIVSLAIVRQANEGAGDIEYDLERIPIRTVGYAFSAENPERGTPVAAGSNARVDSATMMTAASGAAVSVTPGSRYAFSTDTLGLLFQGSVNVTMSDRHAEYAIELGDRRILSRGSNFDLRKLDATRAELRVHDATVEIQSRVGGPRLSWSFDSESHGTLPFRLRGKSSFTAGIVGDGSLQFVDRGMTYAEIIGGTEPTVGSGSFSFGGGLSIEALIVSDWRADKGNQDVIFRKEDGPNRILLSLQHNVNDFDLPMVDPGPVLSFGIFLQQLGYSELDMPLDGRQGRPRVDQIADGKPHHIVATYDSFSGTKSIAVDGRVCFTHQFPIGHCIQSGGPRSAMIGGWLRREPYSGIIDELAIYEYALSPDQIVQHNELAKRGRRWLPDQQENSSRWRTEQVIKPGEPHAFSIHE